MKLLTLSDYTSKMNNAELTLLNATKAVNDARDAYRVAYDPHIYITEAERAERKARTLPVLENAEKDAADAVEAVLTLTREVTAITANPSPSLSPADEAVAASRATFVKEDVESLSLEDLMARIRQAALNNDRVSLFLYHRYGKTRLTGASESTGAHDPGDVAFPRSHSGDALTDLASVLADVEASFRSRDLTTLHVRAIQLRSDAFDLDNAVRARAQQNETYVFQATNEVAW